MVGRSNIVEDAFFLVQPNETTPGIPAEDYELRRRKLMESLPDNSLVVSIAGQVKYMSGREYRYEYL